MVEVNFESLLDAAIEALDGWNDFIEEAVETFLMEGEDYDWVSPRSC